MRPILFFIAALSAEAAVAPRYSLENLVDKSEQIVHGRVANSHVAWDAKHRYLWTHYEVAVIETLKGERRQSLVVSEPGGSLDGVHQQISGALGYGAGEEVYLFLYTTPIGYMRTAGGGQGKFTIGADQRVHAIVQGLEFVPGTSGGTPLTLLDNSSPAQVSSSLRNMVRARSAK